MHESKRQIELALAPVMKASGYHKVRLTWYKHCPETILIFHCEKNRWGANQYYFYSGISIQPELDTIPLYYQCPIQVDLEGLVPDKFDLRQYADFGYELHIDTEQRIFHLTELISLYALPWLESHSTLAELMDLARNNYDALLSKNILIFRYTYDYLCQLREERDSI